MINKDIILVGINARYSHSSFGLRYLYANLYEYQEKAKIVEFVINENPQTLAEQILKYQPKIIGIGVYIWNASDVSCLIETIKKVSPEVKIILGGPEVSHLPIRVNTNDADYIIQGEAEISFYELCKDILQNKNIEHRIHKAIVPKLKELKLPYAFYDQEDIKNRKIYVELSRGCPFECEFCLSAIDEKVRGFNLDQLMNEFNILWQKGAREFKFIDRTFNLNIKIATRLLNFFLEKEDKCSLHFEVIPDHFPDNLKKIIQKFPKGSIQFEIGIQSLNPTILDNINRRMDLKKVEENLHFLEEQTNAHLHVDLIVGLPGESLESLAKNLNKLKTMTGAEIQIGILKKLSGTTIDRHDKKFGMIYSNIPPYDILKNDQVSFMEIQKMKRFARFWDLMYNSGNFVKSIEYLFENGNVFSGFWDFSEWIYKEAKSSWKISLNRLAQYLFEYLSVIKNHNKEKIGAIMVLDMSKIDGRKLPVFLTPYINKELRLQKQTMNRSNKRQLLRG